MTDPRDLLSPPEDGEPITPPPPDVADADDASRRAAAPDDSSPPAADDALVDGRTPEEEAADPLDEGPRRPTGRLRIGDVTKGRYVVLWGRKPSRGDDARPAYHEVDVVEANGPDHAKRLVMADDAPFSSFLKHSAAQKPGILLRAVPAMHWPDTVEPTTFTTPDPILTIR